MVLVLPIRTSQEDLDATAVQVEEAHDAEIEDELIRAGLEFLATPRDEIDELIANVRDILEHHPTFDVRMAVDHLVIHLDR